MTCTPIRWHADEMHVFERHAYEVRACERHFHKTYAVHAPDKYTPARYFR
jgi:hypothetical protein